MRLIKCIQGSPEWHQARLGKITASRVHDILPGKSGPKAARKNYMAQLICEILTGEYDDNTYCSQAMQYGKELESVARSSYEVLQDEFVEEVGFILSDEIDCLGCSPDGIIPEQKKGIEIKCPNPATHIQTIVDYVDKKHRIPPRYYTQIQTSMLVTDFEKWDYISFDNRLPDKLQLYIEEVRRDDLHIKLIIEEIIKFWHELCNIKRKLDEYSGR